MEALLERLPPGLAPGPFKERFLAFIGSVLAKGGEIYVLMASDGKAERPGAIVTAFVNAPYCEPHCYWFPEATPRNRLELALRFLIDMKARYKLLVWVKPADWKFYDHICKYGVLRTVGKLRDFYPDGSDAFLFQGVT